MLQQQFIIDVQGNTQEEINAALIAAGVALGASKAPEDENGVNFVISRGTGPDSNEWAPNTLYVIGTDAQGKPVVTGSRSTTNAARDEHIMSSALELSQASELRGVKFTELRLGGLLVRPAPKPEPMRDVYQEYALSHITDLAKLEDADIPYFVHELPGLIAMLKVAAADGTEKGLNLADVLPVIRYTADASSTVSVRSDTQSFEATGAQLQAGWERTKQAAECPKSTTGQHHVVRDEDSIQHGCCQNCDKVVQLG
jgi:hypothetical protein